MTEEELSKIELEKEAAAKAILAEPPINPVTGRPSPLGYNQQVVNRHLGVTGDAPLESGYKKIDVSYLPSQGLFYPPGAQITIRSASVREVRHWSSIDESDLIDVNERLNYILDTCCRINFPGEGHVTYKSLSDFDRLYLILAIQEISFPSQDTKLKMNITCPECQNEDTITVTKDAIKPIDLSEKLLKYYNEEERCFVFKDDSKNLNLTLYIPTIGISSFLTSFLKKKIQANEHFDKDFIKMAPFVFRHWRELNEKTFLNKATDSFKWSIEEISTIVRFVEVLQKGNSTEIQHVCSKCSTEVTAPLSFRGGLKSLFLVESVLDPLF